MLQQIIKLSEVKRKTTLSSSSIYRKVAAGEFPSPIKLSERSSGWLQTEVENWIDERVKASRPQGLEVTG